MCFARIRLFLVFYLLSFCGCAETGLYNGFDVEGSLVPIAEIHHGGPPRDGIPAIDEPVFITTAETDFLTPDARVLGVALGDESRAYPIGIMNWHEIVNDRVGGKHLAVTYCPLCGSGMAFSAEVSGRRLNFGVSGLLYNSDMLLYDRETQSLWSQLKAQAVTGPLKGTRLKAIPLAHTSWADWRKRHPRTLVLSRDTGYQRDYGRDPYAGYTDRRGLYFPVSRQDPRYHPKERVLGITIDGRHKAYPFAELSRGSGEMRDRLGGPELTIRYDSRHQTADALDVNGQPIPAVITFWFAWYAFHPETDVYEHGKATE